MRQFGHVLAMLKEPEAPKGFKELMDPDATNKWPGKTNREWGRTMRMTPEVTAKMEQV